MSSKQIKSIRDKNGPRPIIVTNEDNGNRDIIIPIIVVVIFVFFMALMLYLLITSNFKTVPTVQDTADLNSQQLQNQVQSTVGLLCPAGTCATNIVTGIKRCPIDDVPIQANGSEVCNERYICNNKLTPYAVRSDGSSDIYGICDAGVECPCINTIRCPSYIQSAFTSTGGNPYQTLAGQKITFPQVNTFVNPNGDISSTPPIQFTDASKTFCTASLDWLPLSNPGCGFTESMDYSTLITCMGLPNRCNESQVLGNPCLQGTLAIISENPLLVNPYTLRNQKYGCVSGLPCACGELAIYDTRYGGIICRPQNDYTIPPNIPQL